MSAYREADGTDARLEKIAHDVDDVLAATMRIEKRIDKPKLHPVERVHLAIVGLVCGGLVAIVGALSAVSAVNARAEWQAKTEMARHACDGGKP